MIPKPDATTSPTGSFSLSFCATNEDIRIAAGPGAIARPVSVVDQCHACCRNRLIPSSCIPKIVAAITIETFAALNTRLRNICGSMTGTAARRVLITNPTAATTATAQLAMMRPFAPAPGVTVEQTEGDGADREDRHHASDRVRHLGREVVPDVRNHLPGDGDRGDPDRQVDQEDPTPAQRREQTADDRADRSRRPRRSPPTAARCA